MEKINAKFSVSTTGALRKFNDVLDIARCRIFYKGLNRNGSYITDEFAEKLIATLPYTPVKGIYSITEEDYTDHGASNDLGKIYGIVPENPNFAWEEHLDEDGITRVYACVDVLYFTALYKEAANIVGQPQSMEIYPPSIKGHYSIIEGRRAFVFEEGSFVGLQILGKEVEPCFEGAGFFSLQDVQNAVYTIETVLNQINEQDIGGSEMEFKLSDNEKFRAIWELLNERFTAEEGFMIDYSICEVYDDYAVVKNLKDDIFERAYYSKEDDIVTITKKEQCYIVDINDTEKQILDAHYTAEGVDGYDFHAPIDSNHDLSEEVSKCKEEISEFEQKIEELNSEKSTLELEKSTLSSKCEELEAFKASVDNKQKEDEIHKYDNLLDEEVINEYIANVENYTLTDLEKELAFKLVQTNASLFSRQEQNLIPKTQELEGIERILSQYEKQ